MIDSISTKKKKQNHLENLCVSSHLKKKLFKLFSLFISWLQIFDP